MPVADALRHADAAMYEAKRLGRARVHVFDASDRERAASLLELSTALHRALASDADELAVHYQPIVALDGDRLVAVEGFARWRHPSLGPVPPAHFVDVAAHAGLGGVLDMWAMRTALRDFATLVDAGVVGDDVRVSVNLTGADLGAHGFVPDVLGALAAAGVSPNQLMLEVSSAVVRRDAAGAARALARLRDRGVWVAIDDFGGATSSVGDLRQLPVDVVKIDRVFVRNIVNARDDLAVVAALVDLAHALGITVVAEGVETHDQRRLLADLRCNHAQGYLWSTPVPASRLSDALYDVPRAGRAAASIGRLRAGGSPSAADDGAVAREHGLLRMLELRRDGASPATIAAALNAEGFRTPSGMRWHRVTVAKALPPNGKVPPRAAV
jgi:EAL domain-containing protein (putative c-di-GMP-specific phosphodiesterase class I)